MLTPPQIMRLGFASTGCRLLSPTFLNLGLPVLIMDYCFIDPAARGILAPLSRCKPPVVSELTFDTRGSDLCIWRTPEERDDQALYADQCVARLPSQQLVLASAIVVIVCRTWLVDQSWAYLWSDHIAGRIGRLGDPPVDTGRARSSPFGGT